MALSLVLADKSALVQHRHEAARSELRRLAGRGLLSICEMVALELLYSARSRDDYAEQRADLGLYHWLPVGTKVMRRALEVQALLARRGQHRRSIPDLIIAATAELHGAEVLHYDRDFELIAEVTGQPVRWILPRGTGH
jgi:predicted nucleic acid-binding protein